jgi:hypothetical protein
LAGTTNPSCDGVMDAADLAVGVMPPGDAAVAGRIDGGVTADDVTVGGVTAQTPPGPGGGPTAPPLA